MILLNQRESDSLQLHKNYSVDMERHHNRLINTEQGYSVKLETLRERQIQEG